VGALHVAYMDKDIVLVTGICGRIGSAVKKKLGKKYHIIGFDRASCKDHIPLDLSSDKSVKDAVAQLPKKKIASVVHLAAYYSFDEEHSPLYDEVTVKGTERLLKALKDFEVDQFIFSSTMLVHEPGKPGCPISEDDLVNPKWEYPLSKVKAEKMIQRFKGDMSSVILRIAGVYDDGCHSIPISHQIQRIYEKSIEARLFSGDITHGSAFLHMDDLVDAIALCIEKRNELPKESVFLIAEPETLSYDQLQRKISFLIEGREFKTWRVPKVIAKLGAWAQGLVMDTFIKPWMIDLADDHYEIDITKAKQILGWVPKHRLSKCLPKMIGLLKSDPDAWYQANQLKK
jgi:nucleoside-diphosphate-sugar epimerase